MTRSSLAVVAWLAALSWPGASAGDSSPAKTTAAAADKKLVLSLDVLIGRAMRGPRVRAAAAKTAAARGRRTQASGTLAPKISVNGVVAPSPSIECLDLGCTETTNRDVNLDLDGIYGRLEVNLVQPLYTFGKLSSVRRAAAQAVQALEFQEDALAGDIALEAARAYYGVKLARELRWMLEDGQAEIEKADKKIKEKLAAGSAEVTLQDRFRLEALAAEVGARLTEARQGEQIALAAVRALAGEQTADVDDEELEAVEFTLAGVEGYAARARAKRPERNAIAAGADAASSLAELEAARFWPDLVLFAGARLARAQGVDDPPSAFANDPFNQTSIGAGLGLRWILDPLTQYGRQLTARANARQAEALVQAVEKGAELQARTAFATASEARKRVDAAAAGERSARGWVAATLQAEAVGTAETKDLADAYIAYFTLRARLLAAVMDWNVAVVALRRSIGEFSRPRRRQTEHP